jgi:hypothetical protein
MGLLSNSSSCRLGRRPREEHMSVHEVSPQEERSRMRRDGKRVGAEDVCEILKTKAELKVKI